MKAGDVFGLWTVLEVLTQKTKRGRTLIACACSCGTQRNVEQNNLQKALSKGCGCTRRADNATRLRVHGHRRDPLYQTWVDMLGRCENPKYSNYHLYGGRGIRVCSGWRNFDDFKAAMGPKPEGKWSVDRIDNGGDYEPGNVRWATQTEQCRNQRGNVLVSLRGTVKTAAEWCIDLSITPSTAYYRMRKGPKLGMSHEEALLSTPEEFRRLSRLYKISNNNNSKGKL